MRGEEEETLQKSGCPCLELSREHRSADEKSERFWKTFDMPEMAGQTGGLQRRGILAAAVIDAKRGSCSSSVLEQYSEPADVEACKRTPTAKCAAGRFIRSALAWTI